MLRLEIFGEETYNSETEEFEVKPPLTLEFEHSLVSLSKWESKFEKPFMATEDKSDEEVLWYIRAMCTTEISDADLSRLTNAHFRQIRDYISSKATATWFSESKNSKPSREIITAEIIYYWMIALQIPFECQYWHLNKLLTLIKVCEEKNTPPDKRRKMSRSEIARRNRELNAQRRAQLNTTG